jgi:hypothetical protein
MSISHSHARNTHACTRTHMHTHTHTCIYLSPSPLSLSISCSCSSFLAYRFVHVYLHSLRAANQQVHLSVKRSNPSGSVGCLHSKHRQEPAGTSRWCDCRRSGQEVDSTDWQGLPWPRFKCTGAGCVHHPARVGYVSTTTSTPLFSLALSFPSRTHTRVEETSMEHTHRLLCSLHLSATIHHCRCC